jgi:hypothetical protein
MSLKPVGDNPTAAVHKGGGDTYVKLPFSPPGPIIGPRIDEETPDGWHQLTNVPRFLKWQYKDSPYRVIADFEEGRGHWRALFTTTFDGPGYLIRGNCGGGESGMLKAVVAANQFMQENENGCPPPSKH